MSLDLGTVIFILLSPVAVAGATVWLLRKWSEKKIDLHFDQKFEQFKHSLSEASAAAQFDYQRRLQDFTLYTAQRHKKYPRLYSLYRDTIDGFAAFADRDHRETDYLNYDVDEISKVLTDESIEGSERTNILMRWDTNRVQAAEMLFEALDRQHSYLSTVRWSKAHNYWIRNYLFLSQEVNNTIHSGYDTFEDFYQLAIIHERPKEELVQQRRDAYLKLSALALVLRTELAAGDYAPTELHVKQIAPPK